MRVLSTSLKLEDDSQIRILTAQVKGRREIESRWWQSVQCAGYAS